MDAGDRVDAGDPVDLGALRHHGDADAADARLDFAVNVRASSPPQWLLQVLAHRLPSLGRYPSAAQELSARVALARRHGCAPEEVLPTAGASEAFAMLALLEPVLAAVIHPSFTEPELMLRQAGVPVQRVVLAPPFSLDGALVPAAAELVVVGNPTNPTSVLHTRRQLARLRAPGRILVVDEAFLDAVPGEPESLWPPPAGPGEVLVIRSLTKTFSLAGLRAGYVLGSPELLSRLASRRAHWPMGTLQLAAVEACSSEQGLAETRSAALEVTAARAAMLAALPSMVASAALSVAGDPAGPFVLLHHPYAETIRETLEAEGIAVRRCDTFPGLGPQYLRLAVRPAAEVAELVAALARVGGVARVDGLGKP